MSESVGDGNIANIPSTPAPIFVSVREVAPRRNGAYGVTDAADLEDSPA
jgi:hypothetical protein